MKQYENKYNDFKFFGAVPNDFDDLPEISKKVAYKAMMPTTDWAIESGEWKNIIHAYLACVSFVDFQVGIVLNALQNSIYKNNTIVVLWSDHGYELGEKGSFGKQTLWSESTRVPLIFKLPGGKEKIKIHQAVELLDIYPTLLDLTGLDANPTNEGETLVPLFTKPNDLSAVAITTYGKNNHSMVNSQYRYIRYEDGSEELYNLKNDPDERNNLSQSSDLYTIKKSMAAHLPRINAEWKYQSNHTINEYFLKTSKQSKKERK